MGSARTTPVVRAILALTAVVALTGIGSGGAAADGPLNAKHFFWAQGQDPAGTVNSLTNDIIYHGGMPVPAQSGSRRRRPCT
jgi:hypothetical protein